MRGMLPAALAIAASALVPAQGQAAGPSFDCRKAQGSAEKLVCTDDQLAALDRETARLFALARDGAHMTPPRRKELVAYQRGWIKGRDDCWKADDRRACVVDAYVTRIHELRQGYADARSQDAQGVSKGPLVARCSNLDALIAVTFVNVDLPLVYLGWRDRVLVLTLGPSGSGARYTRKMAGGDALFWNKGNEALFELPGEKQRNCTIGPPG